MKQANCLESFCEVRQLHLIDEIDSPLRQKVRQSQYFTKVWSSAKALDKVFAKSSAFFIDEQYMSS